MASSEASAVPRRELLGVDRTGLPAMVIRPRSRDPDADPDAVPFAEPSASADGVSISSARAPAGNSPKTLGSPRTRVRREPGTRTPRPRPGSPVVVGEPAAGSGHITPPGRS